MTYFSWGGSKLKQHKMTPAKIPQWKHPDVGYSVREKGIPVPYDWKPSDKSTFIQVFQKEAKKQLTAAVNKDNPRMAQLPLEGFNDFETFLQHPVTPLCSDSGEKPYKRLEAPS